MNSSSIRRLPLLLSVSCLSVCAILAAISSLRWPLVGDAALMHYVVLLLSRGWIPYKEIIDINFPGTYLFEFLPMRLLGGGAVAWRAYDLSLFFVAAISLSLITRRAGRMAGVAAAFFFLLIHLQDGLAQGGQRDLLIAVLLQCSYAALFCAQRNGAPSFLFFFFGLLMGATATIKPTLVPLSMVLLLIVAYRPSQAVVSTRRRVGLALLGMILPSGIALYALSRRGAIGAFVRTSLPLGRLHAELGRRSVAFLLTHATSPVTVVCALWLLVLIFHRPKLDLERLELLAGVSLTLLAYVLQGKGYPYQRYPFLALLLALMAIDIACAATSARRACSIPAIAAIAFACLVLAPRAAWLVHSYRPETLFRNALEEQLRPFGPQLSGNVQCLDTFGGCIDTLYDMRLVQATGYLYDCYLFTSKPNPETDRYRAAFLAEFERARPRVIVLTDQFCFGEDGGFDKLNHWPTLSEKLATAYVRGPAWQSQTSQRWWSRNEYPASFRIYMRKD